MNKIRKIFLWSVIVMLIVIAGAIALRPRESTVSTGTNILKNGDFSSISADGLPTDWYTDSYIYISGYTDYSAVQGIATIENYELNDARFAQ